MNRCFALAVTALLLTVGAQTALADPDPNDQEATGDDALPDPPANEMQTPPPQQTGEAAKEEPTGYFRVDVDKFGPGVWAGAWHKAGSTTIATDIYILGTTGEFDLGALFTFGKLTTTPFLGAVIDFAKGSLTYLAPQLISWYTDDKLYFESWIQFFVGSVLDETTMDFLYTREFLTYKVSDSIGVGPYVELTYQTNDLTEHGGAKADIVSLPVGAAINVLYGQTNSILLFIGYETQAPTGSDGVAGRFSYVRTW